MDERRAVIVSACRTPFGKLGGALKDSEAPGLGSLVIKAGLIEGQVLNADGVENQLATMPGKNELRASLLATMAAPLQQFLQQLNAPGQNFVYLLKAKEDAANKAG